jgi:uncharacterized lipoprotein YbaY/heat shock protein HslJ/uncharacterized lipoprotein NlpE involved in copper resistance
MGLARTALAAVAMVIGGAAMAMDSVTGTAFYRERMAMPPGVVFEARLEDVSRADAPAEVIGQFRMEDAGNPPYAFSIDYDPAVIDDRFTYAVRAELRLDGELLFTTDTMVPVLTRGAPSEVEIMMVRASASEAAAPEDGMPAHGLELPASFAGDLPCADCDAIRHHLDLWPDQAFHLRREWIGGAEPLVRDDIGRWSADPTRNAVILWSGGEPILEFERTNAGNLRLLDQEGRPIESVLPYDLTPVGGLQPTPVAGAFIGEFVYFADAAVFTECRTGLRFPVAMEGDYLALERAYLDARPEPMAPVVVTVKGDIDMREGMEGGLRQILQVDRFDGVWPGLTCERAQADASFDNTYWRIDALDGQALGPVAGRQEPHVSFRSGEDGDFFSATLGCNRINGGFSREGDDGLSLSPGAMTMMACPPPLDTQERQLVDVFGRVASMRITGPTMVFEDDTGQVIARFEAVYLP